MKKIFDYVRKNKKKFSLFVLSIIIILVVISAFRNNKTISHRLQWWLTNIQWDDDRNGLVGRGIKVAVLDSGIDFTHDDLKNINHKEKTYVEECNDDRNHGTAIAGIIAGYPSNDKGILGIAPKTEILSIDITNDEVANVENMISGIEEAIKCNVDIINISVGVKNDSKKLHKIIKDAYEQNIVIVASAGNYMKNEVLFPAAYDEVIAVGSYDRRGNIVSPKGNVKNVIYLPGSNIATTIENNRYAGVNGTSFSTAIMTGIISIIKEKNSNISNESLYNLIYEISKDCDNKLIINKLLDNL